MYDYLAPVTYTYCYTNELNAGEFKLTFAN